MYIIGISAYYHDSAAALLHDGVVVAAAHEERFTRKKHDAGFPANAIKFCLEYGGISLNELDAVIFYDKPLLKFQRLLETYYAFAPKGLRSFLASMPVWMTEKLFQKKRIRGGLAAAGDIDFAKVKLLFSRHHLSHGASAFFPSPFEEAAILTIDGVGEYATASICHGKGNSIRQVRELHFPHSVGLLYSAFTGFLGFKVNSGEYKLMGLAPYGDPDSARTARYEKLIRERIVEIKEDGSIWLNQEYFEYATGLKMVNEQKWRALFGLPAREPESGLHTEHCDMALAIQRVTEEIVIKMAGEAKRLTNAKYLTLAGGVALNCVANGKLLREGIFEDIWIQPAAGDAGGALGAAYAAYHLYFKKERRPLARETLDSMAGSYLGPEYSVSHIEEAGRKYNASFERYDDFPLLCRKTASLLAEGAVVGWFQGRMEWGPRALGNRSILGDARNPGMQKKLNLKIKHREGFRPFAPSVLAEDVGGYFELDRPSPYMLIAADVKKNRRRPAPPDFHALPLKDKLYFLRSDIPSVTHLDYSARIQTVHRETNPRYHQLIKSFKDITGYGLVVNTSFNVRGEPMVCTPDDAYTCFMRTGMDYLVIGDYFFDRKLQPEWMEEKNWKDEYALD